MACWLRKMIDKEKVKPVHLLLEEGPEAWALGVWADAEVRWIAHYKHNGAPLCNSTAGGEGTKDTSPETRARISAAQRNRSKDVQERINAGIKAAHARGAYAHIDYQKKSLAQLDAARAKAAKWTPEQLKLAVERSISARQTLSDAREQILALRTAGLTYHQILIKMNESAHKPRKGCVWALATIANICQKAALGGRQKAKSTSLAYLWSPACRGSS
jgi:hypothetical protein